MRYSDGDISDVLSDIVNSKRDRNALGITRKVGVDLKGLPAPNFSFPPEFPISSFFFVSMLDDRKIFATKLGLRCFDHAEPTNFAD